MTQTSIVAITTITIALWVRRLTWTTKQEIPITANLALQAVAVTLMLPPISNTIGQKIFDWTGNANIEDLIAHDAYIVAGSLILMAGMHTFEDGHAIQQRFKQRVEHPCTLIIPILTWLYLKSDATNTQQQHHGRNTKTP